ncbi:ryanodine receptor 2-like [Platysternon megacephalum]|uniref:Ryanodine receptor 2-like n=1 Tax=Platysternon megacephalum TaxID=55544 RepID=A0A4D9EPW2_9SAUR|nr:ryanodine receptor 2-like [Platysternon megacephalum]
MPFKGRNSHQISLSLSHTHTIPCCSPQPEKDQEGNNIMAGNNLTGRGNNLVKPRYKSGAITERFVMELQGRRFHAHDISRVCNVYNSNIAISPVSPMHPRTLCSIIYVNNK